MVILTPKRKEGSEGKKRVQKGKREEREGGRDEYRMIVKRYKSEYA